MQALNTLNAFESLAQERFAFAVKNGGATRDRTADLMNANHALSQLSYSPFYLLISRYALLRRFNRSVVYPCTLPHSFIARLA